jgi:hypothetical protein
MSSPVRTLGHETFSSISETSERSPTTSTRAHSSAALPPMTFVHSGTGSSASRGRSSAR